MPPSQTPMAFFQRAAGYNLQRLTKLYQDTKQSYESNKPIAASINDDPEVKELRRDFQIQQDRLLAWGMHWGDVEAQYGDGLGGKGLEQDIDKKLDQAGLGEVVASVMSQIKSLLDESGRLQHPGRFEAGRGGIVGDVKRKEWTRHEVQTGRLLLARLTECIDLLYSLSDGREDDNAGQSERKLKSEKSSHGLEDDVEAALYGPRQRQSAAFGNIKDHPLHVEFSQIDFQPHHGSDMSEPPPYGAGETIAEGKDRVVGYWRDAKKPVLIDFLSTNCPPHVVGTSDDVFEMHELGEKLSKHGKGLSWYGHLRLLGFTVEAYRCGMVYELPGDRSQQALQKHQTLTSAINATYNQDIARPALEDRFRLAYNTILSVLGYFANGDSHRHVNSNNILFIPKDDERPQFSAGAALNRVDVRSGYLLQSCQDFVTNQQRAESLDAEIYRHPGHDINNSDSMVPAFDIYSLGLVLLEIGLWVPLSRMWKPDYDRRIFMVRVQRLYSQKLASKMGSKYMRLVQRCLHAPTELLGKNNAHEAATHLLEVAKELRLCLALDDKGMPPSEDIECIELLIIEQMCKSENIGGPAQPSSLPPLRIPGAFREEQEIGITKSDFAGIRRKMVPAPDPVPEQIQPQRRHSRRERRRSAAAALHKWPELSIPQPDLDVWNTMLMPKLSKILQEALQDSPESASVSLMKIGATAENAKTTICVQCHNTARVHDVLRKRFRPKKGWGLVILKGDIRRSGVRRHHKPRRSMGRPGAPKPVERKYQEKPSCGASIGAFRDNEHLPPVSFGGTILVDGEPFGMTVHHMLDAPSEDEDDYSDEEEGLPKRSAATRASQDDAFRMMGASHDLSFLGSDTNFSSPALDISDEDLEMSDDGQSDASTIRPDYSITDDSGQEFWFLDDSSDTASSAPDLVDDDDDDQQSSSSDDEDDAASVGDKPAVLPFSMECDELAVTQPAIDDVDEDFFVGDEDDRDDDHLSSHTLGFVHASSGIRRVLRGQLKHEVDWALIRIDDDRLDTNNRLDSSRPRRPVRGQQRAEKALPSLPTLTKVVPSTKLSNLPVACRARSSGFSSGKISPAMCLVKLHGRHTFSYSWTVDSSQAPPAQMPASSTPSRNHRSTLQSQKPKPDLGIPGDSGAWIYSPETGELAGHVLAYGEKLRQCYIAPMEVLFEDIRMRLGASRVELPGSLAEAVVQGREKREEAAIAMAAAAATTTTTNGVSTQGAETAPAALLTAAPSTAVGTTSPSATAATNAERERERRRAEDERQDSGIGLDQEVEMGLRDLRLDERTQAERRVNMGDVRDVNMAGKPRGNVKVQSMPVASTAN